MDEEQWQRLYGPPRPARSRPVRRAPSVWQPPPVPGFMARYGGGTLVATLAMGAETVVLFLLNQMYLSTRESWALPVHYGGSFILLVFLAPLLALMGLGAVLGFVLPLAALAEWTGKRVRGRDSWWWLPIVVAVACGVLVMAVALPFGAWRGGLRWWAGLTVFLTVPGLAARPALRLEPGQPGLWRAVTLTALGGVGAVALTSWAGAAAFSHGLVETYEPPALSHGVVVGTWSDGQGGTLRLAADGTATATGINRYEDEEPVECSGAGRWNVTGGALEVSVPDCGGLEWGSLGTPERPRLYAFVGDPDARDLYELRRVDD